MPITLSQNHTNLDVLIATWADIWSRQQKSKKGYKWVAFTRPDVDSRLQRKWRKDSSLFGKGFYLTVAACGEEKISFEGEQDFPLPPRQANQINFNEKNDLTESIAFSIDLRKKWNTTKSISESFSQHVDLGFTLNAGLPSVASLTSSINVALDRNTTKQEENVYEQQRNLTRNIPCRPGYVTHISITFNEKKIASTAICPVKLSGYVVVCCKSKVFYNDGASTNNRSTQKQHQKWAVPIGQVLSDLESYLNLPEQDISREQRAIIQAMVNNKLFQQETTTEVYFELRTTVEYTEYLGGEATFNADPLPGYVPDISSSVGSSSQAHARKTIYAKPLVRGNNADLFTITKEDSDKKHQQTLELLEKAGLGGVVYLAEVVKGDYAELTSIPAEGIDETAARLLSEHEKLRRDRHSARAMSEGAGTWQRELMSTPPEELDSTTQEEDSKKKSL